MPVFTCLITDSRYSVPTLSLLITAAEAQAQALARDELQASPFHRAYELLAGDRLVAAEAK
ncbi:hypothetical protein [Phenylobacterium sp.]|jgi:hypothetical protein|uniref:hypothetical protein n=1 Tax=Phenylobacterium sp. TaxID=1871053 RepID=UPI002F948BF2